MGLDVYGLSRIFENKDKDLLYERTWTLCSSGFPQSEGFKEHGSYRASDSFHFRAGSYSSYNTFRSILCETVTGNSYSFISDEISKDMKLLHSIPFAYLLFFSDCEGYIGTEYCKKLVKEFEKYGQSIRDSEKFKVGSSPTIHTNTLDDFEKCFQYGSKDGAVIFS